MTKKNSTKAELLAHIQALEHRVAGSSSGMGNAVDNLAHRKRTPVEYTDSIVVALLELGFNAYRNAFNGSRSAKQLNLLWERLTVQFNIATNQIFNVDADSIKNKLRKLRAEFMVIQRALVQTGNVTPVPKPSYYAEMLTAYASLQGLGDIEFGMECVPLVDDGDGAACDADSQSNNDEYTVPAAKKRKAEVDMEMKRQRQGRKHAQTDISQGLEKFGNTLGAAIVQAANVKNAPVGGPDMAAQMAKLLEVAESTKASIDSSNQVQMKLLAFLETKF
ncbi:hypothetical protein H257_14761 [Aphanomyces astaci]|uniref:Myb/SANT-like domain-containing protein n=1 Tax=Aphanomyces astaci TaxID=112090 RepID=W4FPY7_APHAT|nr:hypothetical protein H257_14761 [Aphanomyces astaci]ETV69525.1 hypothetical protein H257_14761 [Aphanomyces astaci]|eukprot:XP_009840949.1 hypothetical protein H257_14761 [Aphanomyces astaci]